AGARTGGTKAAPWNRARPEPGLRCRALEPGDQRELIVGRRKRRSGMLEARGGDVIDGAKLEKRRRRRDDPAREQHDRKDVGQGRRASTLIAPHRNRGGDESGG